MKWLNKVLSSAQAGASTFTVGPVDARSVVNAVFQCSWTGTLAGTLQVQGSADMGTDEKGTGVTNWTSLSGKSLAPAGSAGGGVIEFTDTPYAWLQVVWTPTSGAGNVNITFNGKAA